MLRKLFDDVFAAGNRLVFYGEFYEAYADTLQGMNIFSEQLLKKALSDTQPSLSFRANYCATSTSITLEQEVLRCYGDSLLLSFDEIKGRIPYVPMDTIRAVLARANDFVWVDTSNYAPTARVNLDDEECLTVCRFINEEIAKKGYATIAGFPFVHSLEMNGGITISAIRSVFYIRYLSDKFERRGNIITHKNAALNYKAIIKEHISSLDHITLDELTAFEEELIGRNHSMALFSASNIMVRINRDDFVSERLIKFNTEAADDAIEGYIGNGVIPLQAITSFTTFPLVEGYRWNWFLLESYCRRFSHKFMYQCLSLNSRSIGALFRKSLGFADYIDVLAYATVEAGIALDVKDVGNFLFAKKYIGARTNSVQTVVEKARLLLEER